MLYDGEDEILLLQSIYESKAGLFGWVVPLPSAPQLATMEPEVGDAIFGQLDRISAVQTIDLSGIKYLILLGLWITALTFVNRFLAKDLYLENAMDEKPYRESKIIW